MSGHELLGTFLPSWHGSTNPLIRFTYRENSFTKSMQDWSLQKRENLRTNLLSEIPKYQDEIRRDRFDKLVPHIDELHLLHPNPISYRTIAKAAREARELGWRLLVYKATIEGLDLTNDTHWRWLALIHVAGYLGVRIQSNSNPHNQSRSPIFHLETPLAFPEGIPVGKPSAHEIAEFDPAIDSWDVEDAAYHELELGAKGLASLYLHNRLPASQERADAIARVGVYLQKNLADLPDDPWDPNNWGHDARLESLSVSKNGVNLTLTPAFDPEVLDYTVDADSLAGTTYRFETKDSLARNATSDTATSRSIVVTAYDKTTKRTYTVSVSSS